MRYLALWLGVMVALLAGCTSAPEVDVPLDATQPTLFFFYTDG